MRVDIGETVMVELWERPSTGRRWRIDREASDRLDMVEIRDLGFVPRRRIGAPGSRLFRIEAVGEGTARIIFLREAPTPSRRFTLVLETL
ncbi:protease inhibitor I42 family protein [Methylosinus sp. Sm6]|uniref:protease inhibitor I42 family protein n=1 Tax=Methylosinus sp. Sm6 TaxID=2866948 RepID=UPI001C99BABA|nr:protease inhibitor I42 family protein [Methylosinus sp. Sm6]MBY6241220.1 protease inhibitor I42 family protein [Methylosinus sp. Sm6]